MSERVGARAQAALLEAEGAGDVLLGDSGDETLISRFNRTILSGDGGDDVLDTRFVLEWSEAGPEDAAATQIGGTGEDVLAIEIDASGLVEAMQVGGAGRDTLEATLTGYGELVTVVQTGGGGADTITATATSFAFDPGTAKVTVSGGRGADTIDVTASAEFAGNGRALTFVTGGAGDDQITARALGGYSAGVIEGRNVLEGGAGDDRITAEVTIRTNSGQVGENRIDGGDGDDRIEASVSISTNDGGGDGRNDIDGGDGDDVISAWGGGGFNTDTRMENVVDGGDGDDRIDLRLDVSAMPMGGPDGLYGKAVATNVADGGDGGDTIRAEAHAIARGEEGDQAEASNTIAGGRGGDVIVAVAEAFADWGYEGQDARDPGAAYNRLAGNGGRDKLKGEITADSAGASFLDGGGGNDRLVVVGGMDNRLDGGRGADRLKAGDGDDHLIGGAGADTFQFDLRRDQGTDRLLDFDVDRDRLDFRGLTDAAGDGLLDDLLAVATLTDGGPGGDVTLRLDSGTTLVFVGLGTDGDLADLLAGMGDQLLA